MAYVATASAGHHGPDDRGIAGTWDVTLTVRNCTTGIPVATIRELTTFDGAGTVIGSTSERR
jgi:hypothetical protein